jgi:histo-blood group ABO system transferase
VDYLFMCDADMRFVGTVGDEILGDVVATIHPGFFSQPADGCSFDRNPNSRAFVRPGTGRRYYAGGFQGGRTEHYMAAVQTIAGRIDEDEANGVMALWHDESHWNRYLVDQPPMVELSPAYCYPEGWRLPFEQRLLALNKNHGELRT